MPLRKPVKYALAAIAFIALAAIALVWAGSRTDYARRLVGGWITEATGLPSTVESLSIGFLRGPSVELRGIAIAQPAGFGDEPLIEVGRLRVEVPWSSLFGDLVAESVEIDEAVLRPTIAADGSDNWSVLIETLTGSEDEAAAPAWSVGRLDVEKSAVHYSDLATDTRLRLTAITIGADELSAASDFPVELRLAGVSGTHSFHLAFTGRGLADTDAGRFAASGLSLRGWAGGEPLPLAGVELIGTVKTISFDSASGLAAVDGGAFNLAGIPGEFSGSMTIGGKEERSVVAFRTESFAPRAPAVAFGVPLPTTADSEAFSEFQISVEGELRDGIWHLDPIEGQLDDTLFNGRLVPEQRLIRVAADRIEVDRYLAPGEKRRREKKATLEAAIAELAKLDIDAEIRIGEALVAGSRLKDTVIRIERNPAASQ